MCQLFVARLRPHSRLAEAAKRLQRPILPSLPVLLPVHRLLEQETLPVTGERNIKQCDNQYITRLMPGLKRFEVAAICRYYCKLPRDLQVEVHRLQTDIMRTRSPERETGKYGEYAFALFLQAITQIRSLERAGDARQVMADNNGRRIEEIRAGRVKARKEKPAPTRQVILKKYLQLIEQLLMQGYSWRQIALYIKRYHRQTFSHNYLRQVYLASKGEVA